MPSPWTSIHVECLKLRRSLAAALAAAVPLLIAVFMFFNLLRDKHPRPWDMWMLNIAGVWAFFMLPMSVTALAALLAQIEHGPRSWDHLGALPLPRWHLYAAKLIGLLAVVALMSVAVFLAGWTALQAAALFKPALMPTGGFAAMRYLGLFGRIYFSALLLVAVQLWIALRYASFVPALATGIGGTFFAVVGTSARIGVVLPWQIPVNMLATDPLRVRTALLIGSLGGCAALMAMLVHLSRREVH